MDAQAAVHAIETGDWLELARCLDYDEMAEATLDATAVAESPMGQLMWGDFPRQVQLLAARAGVTVITVTVPVGGKGEIVLHGPHGSVEEAMACFEGAAGAIAERVAQTNTLVGLVNESIVLSELPVLNAGVPVDWV